MQIIKVTAFYDFYVASVVTEAVYNSLALSLVDFLKLGAYRPKCQKIFHAIFVSLYSFAALANWHFFGTSQNARPDTASFSGYCERGLTDSPYVQCFFKKSVPLIFWIRNSGEESEEMGKNARAAWP